MEQMKFLSRSNQEDGVPPPDTTIGVGSSFRGTLMVSGTLRIEGELEGDILNCERLVIGEHGVMRADIEVKEAVIDGHVHGNIRAFGTIALKSVVRHTDAILAFTVGW